MPAERAAPGQRPYACGPQTPYCTARPARPPPQLGARACGPQTPYRTARPARPPSQPGARSEALAVALLRASGHRPAVRRCLPPAPRASPAVRAPPCAEQPCFR
eukprot:6303201-Alexandrium_andersonii.AAC.1